MPQSEGEVVPKIKLSSGDASSMSGPPLPAPYYLSNEGKAMYRFSIDGNAIFTVGANSRRALANARALLEHGLSGLAFFDLDPSKLTADIDTLKKDFPSAIILPIKADVTNADQLKSAVDMTVRELGGVNVLCCFADVAACEHAIDTGAEEWRRTLDINTTGSFLSAQAVARKMISLGQTGAIVFVAGISAHRVNYTQPQAAYNASKAALVSLTTSLAAEWARYGIRVNSISPGYFDTDPQDEEETLPRVRRSWEERCPMGRMGLPEELAGPLVMLCSGAGSYITGVDLKVDGGQCCF